jgi:hypothetical protein
MTTIKSISTRSGEAAWVVTWGKGLTQSAIALSWAEAEALARGERLPVEPLLVWQ